MPRQTDELLQIGRSIDKAMTSMPEGASLWVEIHREHAIIRATYPNGTCDTDAWPGDLGSQIAQAVADLETSGD